MNLKGHFTGTYGTMYYVRDVGKAAKFYSAKFGFKVLSESKFWAEIASPGGQMICLHLAEKKMKKLPGGILIQNVKRMTALIKKLKASGVKFSGEPHCVHGDDYTTHYFDPDGNEVSLYGKLK